MRISFFLIVLLIPTIIGFVGCSRDGIVDDLVSRPEPDLTIADMTIRDVKILISESRPAQVTVVVTGYLSCESHHETHQSREGDTINIQITTGEQPNDICTMPIEYQEEIPIGTFAIGEYKLIVNGTEHGFGVEDNGHWITIQMPFIASSLNDGWIVEDMPIGNNFEILISESRPAQVMVKGSAWFSSTCAHLHRTHQTREEDTINIQIKWRTGEEGSFCGDAVIEVPVQVSVGTFGVGEYTVFVNGFGRMFRIE